MNRARIAGLEALQAVAEARPGADSDAVGGAVPALVASPATVDEAAAVLRVAAAHGWRVAPRGGGTKLDWGCPPQALDLIVDTGRLDRIVEHAFGDLVVMVQAGVELGRLQRELSGYGQQLALDEAVPGSTVGGVLATGVSGPRRLRYGTPRDLVIGVTVVRADGTVAHSGGKVVKNVAGYDLGKIYTGSYGTLGLIVEAAFRLHPLPEAARTVTVTAPDAAAAYRYVRAVLGSSIVPTAVEIDQPEPEGPLTVAVLVEGTAKGVATRAADTARLLGETATVATESPPWWGSYPADRDGVLVKVAAEISALPRVLDAVGEAASASRVMPAVRGSAGAGVLYAGLGPGIDAGAAGRFVQSLRGVIGAPSGPAGSVTVIHAPAAIRGAVDMWGPVPALALMRRVKDQFDPEHRLAPGRFACGI